MGGGGVSGQQRNTSAGALADIARTGQVNQQQAQAVANRAGNTATSFFTDRTKSGLPFYRNLTDYGSGTVAQAFAPQRADILRRTDQMAYAPSGYRDALLTNLGAQQGRAFDSSLVQAMMANEMAKQQGVAGLQGEQQLNTNAALGYGSQGLSGNQAVLTGPGRPSVGGVLGGIGQGLLNAGTQLASAYVGNPNFKGFGG